MLLPWPLVVRTRWSRLRALVADVPMRFAIVWAVPTFVIFSIVSGKQPHYLLPLIPGVALGLAHALDRDALRTRVGLFGMFTVVCGAFAAALHLLAPHLPALAFAADVSPVWGIGIALVGVALLFARARFARPLVAATAMLGIALLIKLAVLQSSGDRYDLDAISTRIHDAQAAGHPVVHLGWHHGVYEFAGRLREPVPAFETLAEFETWAREHPDGYVVTFYRRFRFRAEPVHAQKFRGGEMAMWKASDALASGVDPTTSHARDEIDDSDD